MRALPFVLTTLALGALLIGVSAVDPWALGSVATWAVRGWIVMVVVAAVIGFFAA